ncbi:unnamed protein product [Penicillium camemberti]|uniref:Str. FM013 n=1 Tax=Penicillium camemberti (strain FM 013) TaxID=1429867 RepID=A0A0G4PF60_PENC3|nr:unnamed protein product [Penicillium camemberti]
MVTWSLYCGLIALIFWSALFDDSMTQSHVNLYQIADQGPPNRTPSANPDFPA